MFKEEDKATEVFMERMLFDLDSGNLKNPNITNLSGTPNFTGNYQKLGLLTAFNGVMYGTFTLASSVLTPPVIIKLYDINGGSSITKAGVLFVDNNGTLTTVKQNNDGTFTLPNGTITTGYYRYTGFVWGAI
jgi:hypothetical protein